MSTEPDSPIETDNPFNYAHVEYANYIDFADEHDVHQEFLSFQYRRLDPVATMTELTKHLDSRPPTRQRLSTNAIVSEVDPSNAHNVAASLDTFMLLHGWWRDGRTASGTFYCNPEYVHDHGTDTIRDSDERADLLRRVADLGLPMRVLGPAFGLSTARGPKETTKAVFRVADRIGVEWGPRRDAGVTTMARTFKTLAEWGYPHHEIGTAFGRPRRTVTDWINRDAADFSPPADPTHGFTRGD